MEIIDTVVIFIYLKLIDILKKKKKTVSLRLKLKRNIIHDL